MSEINLCKKRLVLIYVIVSVTVFQHGVDFQLMMYTYHSPTHVCLPPNGTFAVIEKNNCFYTVKANSTTTRHECEQWDFDRSQIETTFVSDLSLVCQHKYLQLLIMPIRTLSTMFNILLAFFSDIKGRRLLFLISIFMDSFLWILLAVWPLNYVVHVLLRSLKAFGSASSMIGFVLLSELTPTKHRNMIGTNYWIPFSMGLTVAPLYIWATRNWRSAYLISAIPNIVYVFAPLVILESPQWLQANNRQQEANDVSIQLDTDLSIEEMESVDEENSDFGKQFVSFVSSATLICRLAVLCISSFTLFFVYQGISTNLTFATSNIYIGAIVLGLIEIPSGPISYLCSFYLGSVFTTSLGLGLAAMFYTINTVVTSSLQQSSLAGNISKLVLACLVRFIIAGSWNIQGVFYITLMPTTLRNFITNFGEIFGILGASIGLFAGYYLSGRFIVTNIIYDSLLLISMLLIGLIIPTLEHRDLPRTVNEAKAIKKKFI